MYSLNSAGRLLTLDPPRVMGILNITPDSFYSGSRVLAEAQLLQRVETMIGEGASIIDIGAQSTRPDSRFLSAEEEWERLLPVLPGLCRRFPDTIFSIDSFYAQVAQRAVEAGAGMVNDISGGQLDAALLPAVGTLGVPYVCMHMRGTPQTMQTLTSYEDLVLEISDYFIGRIAACRAAGIKDIVLDPGFGFAKTVSQNFTLLNRLEQFQVLGYPLLLGVSRKSSISKTLGITAEAALNGTTVLNTVGLMKGAAILRVHDVKEAVEAVKLVKTMQP
ncbi:MAG: dihydropteroate synthase [Flavihumibacter sp.]